ncbi:MAG: Heteropolysaccharide repeat unit export protein [Microgenomates group bacterium GW2011_GWC1_38_14]|nr:MAG: Heteropolysaccharide repeat unit export protein [Candidatus Levybacteria bacterium GW2011_GWA2_36_13]KKQ00932.1 MAG: Heteropolysaccharide repeat unit export protein [Candidatus Levybacteria bacterium GW2011_GWB1_36_18]KKQ58465.1 MAG: Heteropolysaccharide repeat unit export protein [Microgenomates group bacterium GW2011_GWC1_38_14]KKR17690.1 MAG: Heteropolysaccharide repeat unit export protein [Candidatus Levybacteria bacterium GW2011_GWA1_39_32]
MNKTYLNLGTNTIIQSIGKILSILLGLISISILTRYLGVNNYGIYSLSFAYLAFFGAFSDLGLQAVAVNEIIRKKFKNSFGTYFWLKLFLSFASVIIPLVLLLIFPYSSVQKMAIVVAAIAFGLGNMIGFGNAFFQAELKLTTITFLDVFNKFITVLLITIFILLKKDLFFILGAVLFGNLITLTLSMIFLKEITNFKFDFESSNAKILIKKSIPLGLALLLGTIYFKADTIMLSLIKGSKDVGIYSLSYRIFENLLIFWGFYIASFYPVFSKYFNQHEVGKYQKLIKSSVFLAIFLGTLVFLVGIIIAPSVVRILAGVNFNESINPLRILLLSSAFFFINTILYYYFFLTEKSKVLISGLFLSLLFNVLINLFFITKYSYVGASISTVLTEMFLLIIYCIALVKINYSK